MKESARSPRAPLPVLFLMMILAIHGCGGGDDGVTPEPPATPLVSGTVGVEGGEMIGNEVALTIPPGALAGDTDLQVYQDEEIPFAGGRPGFRIEGLPEFLGAAVTLRLASGGGKAGGTMVFLGEERDSYEGGRGLTWFEVASEDSSGWAVVQLDRGPYVLDQEKTSPSLRVVATEGLERSPTSAGHYEVIYDPARTSAGQVALIAAKLEQAWSEVTDLGFQFGGADIWPRPVYLRDIEIPGRLAQYTVAPHGKGHFTVDPDALANSVVTGIILGHEVLHSAQDHFDTRPPSTWKTLNIQRLWLDEATASWFEERFFPEDDSYPIAMDQVLYVQPLKMFAGNSGISWAEMGYGLSSLVKYVVDAQGEDRILQFYERFVETGTGAAAFQDVVDPDMTAWVMDYFHRLVTGSIYPFLQPGELWYEQGAVGAIVGGETHGFSDTWRLWEMATGSTFFTVTDDRDTPAEALKVRSGGGPAVHVSLFGLPPGGHPVLLGTAADSLVVEGLPGLLESYERFMALGVRVAEFVPGDADVIYLDPEIELVDDDLARFEFATVGFGYGGTYCSGYTDQQLYFYLDSEVGRVQNHIYTAAWDSLSSGGQIRYTGQFTIDLDPATMNVLSWSASQTTQNAGNSMVNTIAISGTAVPLVSTQPDEYRWRLGGTTACGAVTELSADRYYDGELDDCIADWWCNEDSYLVLLLQDND